MTQEELIDRIWGDIKGSLDFEAKEVYARVEALLEEFSEASCLRGWRDGVDAA